MDFYKALAIAFKSGDESHLRKIPEGREFLLGLAKERRKVPVAIRRFPKIAGETMAKTIDQETLNILRGGK